MERPDGSQATTFGWLLIVVGIIAIFIGSGAETLEGLVWAVLIANLGVGVGILLVSLGYLVRAIWFLPGREGEILEAMAQPQPEEEREGFHFCDWCHLGLYAPDVACSRQSEEEILADLENGPTPQKACHAELTKRGFLAK